MRIQQVLKKVFIWERNVSFYFFQYTLSSYSLEDLVFLRIDD